MTPVVLRWLVKKHLGYLAFIQQESVTWTEKLIVVSLWRVHIDINTSPDTRVRVIVNTSLHVFQQQPFIIMLVLYEYELP